MDNFSAIYAILSFMDEQFYCSPAERRGLNHTKLGISKERLERILALLQKAKTIRRHNI